MPDPSLSEILALLAQKNQVDYFAFTVLSLALLLMIRTATRPDSPARKIGKKR